MSLQDRPDEDLQPSVPQRSQLRRRARHARDSGGGVMRPRALLRSGAPDLVPAGPVEDGAPGADAVASEDLWTPPSRKVPVGQAARMVAALAQQVGSGEEVASALLDLSPDDEQATVTPDDDSRGTGRQPMSSETFRPRAGYPAASVDRSRSLTDGLADDLIREITGDLPRTRAGVRAAAPLRAAAVEPDPSLDLLERARLRRLEEAREAERQRRELENVRHEAERERLMHLVREAVADRESSAAILEDERERLARERSRLHAQVQLMDDARRAEAACLEAERGRWEVERALLADELRGSSRRAGADPAAGPVAAPGLGYGHPSGPLPVTPMAAAGYPLSGMPLAGDPGAVSAGAYPSAGSYPAAQGFQSAPGFPSGSGYPAGPAQPATGYQPVAAAPPTSGWSQMVGVPAAVGQQSQVAPAPQPGAVSAAALQPAAPAAPAKTGLAWDGAGGGAGWDTGADGQPVADKASGRRDDHDRGRRDRWDSWDEGPAEDLDDPDDDEFEPAAKEQRGVSTKAVAIGLAVLIGLGFVAQRMMPGNQLAPGAVAGQTGVVGVAPVANLGGAGQIGGAAGQVGGAAGQVGGAAGQVGGAAGQVGGAGQLGGAGQVGGAAGQLGGVAGQGAGIAGQVAGQAGAVTPVTGQAAVGQQAAGGNGTGVFGQ